jgi:hypothetical protein
MQLEAESATPPSALASKTISSYKIIMELIAEKPDEINSYFIFTLFEKLIKYP